MGTSPSSATEAVLDASAVVRALAYLQPDARAWFGMRVAWPTLVYAEAGNALRRLVRTRAIDVDDARRSLRTLLGAVAAVRPVETLVWPAWAVALERSLTVYDACYVVMAETLGVPLVTADRRLAEATANAVLLG